MKQYLILADQICAINQRYSLKPNEIKLLDMVAKRYIQNEPMIVSELIHNRQVASPATLHMTLKSLVSKKLITAKIDSGDTRRKTLTLTKLALDRYKKLNSLVAGI
jgi:DNA-binding MarR family transcriptional regulator